MDFTLRSGEKVKKEAMYNTSCRYALGETEHLHIVKIPYQRHNPGKDVYMVVAIPKNNENHIGAYA